MQSVYNIHKQYITCLQNPSRFFTNLIAVIVMILFPAFISAQSLRTTGTYEVGDFIIPNGINSIVVTAIGGDGGNAITFTSRSKKAGIAALIKGTFLISASSCSIGQITLKPGGKLRFVITVL